MPIKKGDNVKVEYTGTLQDGSVFDSSEKHGKPLEFEVGAGNMISGFDNAVVGMSEGEEKEFTLEPKDAYGDVNPQLNMKIPREKIPAEEVKPGMVVMVGLKTGQQVPAKVTEVDEKEVTLDLNHPLAGKKLTFKIKIVGVSS